MRNIFKMFVCIGAVVGSMVAFLGGIVRAIGGADWVAIPVEVSLDDPAADSILISKYCGRQLECAADMELSDGDATYMVQVCVRVVSELLAVNPADWHTHEIILFYDQSLPELPDIMKIRKNSWDSSKIRLGMSVDAKNMSWKQLEVVRLTNGPKKFSLTCHFDGGEDVLMRGSITFSYNYFENEGWMQSIMPPRGLTCPRPLTPPSKSPTLPSVTASGL